MAERKMCGKCCRFVPHIIFHSAKEQMNSNRRHRHTHRHNRHNLFNEEFSCIRTSYVLAAWLLHLVWMFYVNCIVFAISGISTNRRWAVAVARTDLFVNVLLLLVVVSLAVASKYLFYDFFSSFLCRSFGVRNVCSCFVSFATSFIQSLTEFPLLPNDMQSLDGTERCNRHRTVHMCVCRWWWLQREDDGRWKSFNMFFAWHCRWQSEQQNEWMEMKE